MSAVAFPSTSQANWWRRMNQRTLVELYRSMSPEAVKEAVRVSLAAQPATNDKWADSLVAYLTLVNGGAATAMLAFAGTIKSLRENPTVPVALVLFILGLVVVGGLWIAQGRRLRTYDQNLQGAVHACGNQDLDTAREFLVKIADVPAISPAAFVFAQISFGLFVAGCLTVAASPLFW